MADLISKIKGVDNVTYDLQDKVSIFGGTNLFVWNGLKTYNQELTLNDYNNTGSFTQFTNSLKFDPTKTVGQKYTISFDAISPNGDTAIQVYNSNGKPKYFNWSAGNIGTATTSWKHFQCTITNNQNTASDASTNEQIWKRIEIYAPSKMKVRIRNVKVEIGTKPTEWTPAPQDLVTYSSEILEFFQ